MSCDGIKYLVGLMAIFKKYASKDQDTMHLNKSELKELLENEFSILFNNTTDPNTVKKVLSDLDMDKDGQVDMQEYFITVCCLGLCLSDVMEKTHCPKKK